MKPKLSDKTNILPTVLPHQLPYFISLKIKFEKMTVKTGKLMVDLFQIIGLQKL